jgi:O-antigen ligase
VSLRAAAASRPVAAVLLVGAVVVPCVFWTRLDAVFAVPKLAALWALLVVAIAALAAGVVAGRTPALPRPLVAADVAAAAFVLLEIAAWATSSDRHQSLYGERLQYQGLLTTLLYGAFYVLARLALAGPARMWAFAAAAVAGGTLVAGYALVQRAGLDPIWEGFLPGGRVFSSLGQSNALAAYLVLVLPLAVAVAAGPARGRLPGAIALAALLAAFVPTLSRGGFLGLLAAGAVLAVAFGRALLERRRPVAIVAATGLVAAAAVTVLVPQVRDRIEVGGESFRFHRDAWRVAAHVAADHPLLGSGPETFPDVFPRYSHDVLSPERAAVLDAFRVESPHNVYLGIAAGAGLPALAAYVALIAASVAALLAAIRRATGRCRVLLACVLAAVAGHLVTDAFMTPEVTGTWLFWVLLGGAAALRTRDQLAASRADLGTG